MNTPSVGPTREQAETNRQVDLIFHMYEHARARRGTWLLPETEMVHDCWVAPVLIGMDDVHAWAHVAAEPGDPSATWCPILNPASNVTSAVLELGVNWLGPPCVAENRSGQRRVVSGRVNWITDHDGRTRVRVFVDRARPRRLAR